MHPIRFRPGLCPRPRWGSLQSYPDFLAGFQKLTLREREGKRKDYERAGEGRGKGKGRKMKERGK